MLGLIYVLSENLGSLRLFFIEQNDKTNRYFVNIPVFPIFKIQNAKVSIKCSIVARFPVEKLSARGQKTHFEPNTLRI